ncbi:MAG: ATP cone domain-containing protein [Candidatus Bipolaricaulaceae bacterium]
MAVQNRIRKVQKRDRSLVPFDQGRIVRAILRAARSVGGFALDHLHGVNDRWFQACGDDEHLAEFVSDIVVATLNRDRRHWIANFPPTIEEIQDTVLHVLRSFGFVTVADAYECWRWGKYWVRTGALPKERFVGNGYPSPWHEDILAWNREHGCDTVEGLSEIVRSGRLARLVEEATAVYEESLDRAAAKVLERLEQGDDLRMIWISGPSSSGKTTTTVKLTRRLKAEGLRFLMVNLDDYFWPVVEHPTDWLNDRNFETPEALDIQTINRHLRALLAGETVEKPIYSFKEGTHVGTRPVKLGRDQLLLLDCLHGFYPPLTAGIERQRMFRLYIEAANMLLAGDGTSEQLTQFTDVRLLRRMLRDARHRNHPPLQTLLHWHYVRAGELFAIIPLLGLADHLVNGGMPFDLPVLKPYFTPDGIWPGPEELVPYASFLDARIRYHRISELFRNVAGLTVWETQDSQLIPGDHLVREFIGGSTLEIPHNE